MENKYIYYLSFKFCITMECPLQKCSYFVISSASILERLWVKRIAISVKSAVLFSLSMNSVRGLLEVTVVVVSPPPICTVFTITYLKQTLFLGPTVLQLFCSYSLWYI